MRFRLTIAATEGVQRSPQAAGFGAALLTLLADGLADMMRHGTPGVLAATVSARVRIAETVCRWSEPLDGCWLLCRPPATLAALAAEGLTVELRDDDGPLHVLATRPVSIAVREMAA